MKLSPDDQATVLEALQAVRACGEACTQQPNTEAQKAALLRVRAAAMRAFDIITTTERDTRNAAEDARVRKLTQRLETMA